MAEESLDDLANAALDGDEAALEIARLDPHLQALIAEHRRVRNALRTALPPGAADQRQDHLQAALAVFDEILLTGKPEQEADSALGTTPSSATDHPQSNVVTLVSKRRRKQRWLNVAAAAAVVSVGAIAAVNLTAVESSVDDSAESSADSTEATAEASFDEREAADRATASGAAPLEDAVEDFANVEPAADTESPDDLADRLAAETPEAAGSVATATTASGSAATTIATDDTLEFGVSFPKGALDARFLDCLPEFDVPDRPWVASETISDDPAALELLVGDDFDTIYHFEFDPTSCILIAPAGPIAQN